MILTPNILGRIVAIVIAGVADRGLEDPLRPVRDDLGRDGAGVVGDQGHLGAAAGHGRDRAGEAVTGNDGVAHLHPVPGADVDRYVGEPDAR